MLSTRSLAPLVSLEKDRQYQSRRNWLGARTLREIDVVGEGLGLVGNLCLVRFGMGDTPSMQPYRCSLHNGHGPIR
jgi:hypothetical protein